MASWGKGVLVDVIVGRAVVCLGVAVMTAAAVNARDTSLVSLTAVGFVVMVLGLACFWHALPPRRWQDPQAGSPWRFPVASGAVTLAMSLAAAPLLAPLMELHQELWLPSGCAFVLVQAWVVARLDRALGRFGRHARRRFLLSLATSSGAMTAAAVLVSLAGDPGLSRWPAFVNAGVVVVVSAAGSLFSLSPGSGRSVETDDWGGSGAAWKSVVGDRVERGAGGLGRQVGAERLAPPVRR